MDYFCQYRHIFGIEREGVHSYRIFDIAVVDVLATVIVSFLLFLLFRFSKMKIPFIYCLGGLFITGIIAHRIFCVRTKIDTILFPEDQS